MRAATSLAWLGWALFGLAVPHSEAQAAGSNTAPAITSSGGVTSYRQGENASPVSPEQMGGAKPMPLPTIAGPPAVDDRASAASPGRRDNAPPQAEPSSR